MSENREGKVDLRMQREANDEVTNAHKLASERDDKLAKKTFVLEKRLETIEGKRVLDNRKKIRKRLERARIQIQERNALTG